MREIEFRAWYKKLNIMCDVAAINFYYENVVLKAVNTEQVKLFTELNEKALIHNLHDRLSVPMDGVVLMQYTGLKDKNGKEIFEGDIVDRNEQYPEVVMFYQGDWVLDYSYSRGKEPGYCYCNLGFYCEERKACEVIGNIYDNPELLEVEE